MTMAAKRPMTSTMGAENHQTSDNIVTKLLSVPTNRICADCRVLLVDDSTRIYASVVLISKVPKRLQFGVFVCKHCATAHKQLQIATTTAIPCASLSVQEARLLKDLGGNARSWNVLEARYNKQQRKKKRPLSFQQRPTKTSSLQERLIFCQMKYQTLAYSSAGQRKDPRRLRIAPSLSSSSKSEIGSSITPNTTILTEDEEEHDDHVLFSPPPTADIDTDGEQQLPSSRLVDYFCIVGTNGARREMLMMQHDDDGSVEFEPRVLDYFPRVQHDDMELPAMLSPFVFPDGCRCQRKAQPPTFFPFVLGDSLYGGALTVYDETTRLAGGVTFGGKLPARHHHGVFYVPKCLVILSHYPFFSLWKQFLCQVYRLTTSNKPLQIPVERHIANFCLLKVPFLPSITGSAEIRYQLSSPIIAIHCRTNHLPLTTLSYRPLFSCLSVRNIIIVMACLMQETSVALFSSHVGLLGVVAETLKTLLFPFEWQGLYLPILPCSMMELLEAPVPFFVGCVRLPKEEQRRLYRGVVFVDLDKDCVHLGHDNSCPKNNNKNQNATPGSLFAPKSIPCLPEKDALKLQEQLEQHGAKAYLAAPEGGTVTTGSSTVLLTGEAVQDSSRRDKVLATIDEAYHVEPPSPNGARNDVLNIAAEDDKDMSVPAEEIRGAFLRFFVSVFRNYRSYFLSKSCSGQITVAPRQADAFVQSLNCPKSASFMRIVVQTQMFHAFLEQRRACPHDPHVILFDDSIFVAKRNRSKVLRVMMGKKRKTPFLDNATVVKTIAAPAPSNAGLADDACFRYDSFPKSLDENLFGTHAGEGKMHHGVFHRLACSLGLGIADDDWREGPHPVARALTHAFQHMRGQN